SPRSSRETFHRSPRPTRRQRSASGFPPGQLRLQPPAFSARRSVTLPSESRLWRTGRRSSASPVSPRGSCECGNSGATTSNDVGANLTREQRSKTMSRIRRRDTKPEKILRQAVWARGLRGYRLDDRRLPGRPDLAWMRKKVAVFIDGAFWHGHPKAFTP